MTKTKKRIPVILDTDIGNDIDDTWAIAALLKTPELDPKLIVSGTGNTTDRLKIVAKFLEVAQRTDIELGIGLPFDRNLFMQRPWIADYELSHYPGKIHSDGVQAIIDTIMQSPEPVTLICIGPVPNIGEALRREPRIAKNAKFVGMHGAMRKGYGNSPNPAREYNVAEHTSDCQKAFTAEWDMVITPLDTCGMIVLKDELYQKVWRSTDPVIQALMENYRIWLECMKQPVANWERISSTLFDVVAIYLAFTEENLVMEDLGIRVTDDGYTRIDDSAKHIRVATDWKDLNRFHEFVADWLLRPTMPAAR